MTGLEFRPPGPHFGCLACGLRASENATLCPGCGVLGAFGWTGGAGEAGGAARPAISRLSSLAEKARPLRMVSTGDARLDGFFGGGVPLGTATTLFGRAGAGKSSLAVVLAAGLARALSSRAIFVCPEMSRAILQSTAERAGGELERLYPGDAERWPEEAREIDARVLVLDSVSRMREPAAVLHLATDWARAGGNGGRIALCLTHRSRAGTPLGPVALEHDADTVLEVTLKRGVRRIVISKCRWGAECGSFVLGNSRKPRA